VAVLAITWLGVCPVALRDSNKSLSRQGLEQRIAMGYEYEGRKTGGYESTLEPVSCLMRVLDARDMMYLGKAMCIKQRATSEPKPP
jgi:hypothetical protein